MLDWKIFFCWLNNIHLCWKTVNENHQIVDATDQLSIINYDDDLDIHWLINEKEKITGNQLKKNDIKINSFDRFDLKYAIR